MVVEHDAASRDPVMVPFRCPRCAGEQSADLVALSRAGSALCTACGRRLTRAEISEAIHRARRPDEPTSGGQRGRLWA